LDRGILLAITGSLLVFGIILAIIFYNHSDFDQRLIVQVDNCVPSEKLIPQIDKETEKLIKNAQRRFQSNVVNKNFGNGNRATKNGSEYYLERYENEMKMISEYDAARKKFARREITKEQFINEIEIPKEDMQLLN